MEIIVVFEKADEVEGVKRPECISCILAYE